MNCANVVDHIEMLWKRKRPKKYTFTKNFEIEKFNGSDMQKSALYSLWFEKDGTKEEIEECFQNKFASKDDLIPEKDIFFVKHQNKYIGTITAIFHKSENLGHVHHVVLANEYRGKRLSYPLMYIGMEKLYKDGCRFVFLKTDDWRMGAVKSYLNYGFLPQIDLGNFERAEDHIKRWKSLFKEFGIKKFKFYDESRKIVKL